MSATKARRLAKALSSYTQGPPCNPDGTYTIGNCSPDVTCTAAAELLRSQADEIERRLAELAALRAQQPLAWCVLAENGNCIIWSRDLERVQWSAARVQRPVIALYTEARPQDPCTWSLDDDPDRTAWHSACGQSWMFTDGGPAENHVRYCHGCGRPVQIVQPAEAPSE